jgi:hypothetical protein
MSKLQTVTQMHNWVLFRVAGLLAATSDDIYLYESEEVRTQAGKVSVEARELQRLLRERRIQDESI